MKRLIDVVGELACLSDDEMSTIYACKPWTCDSHAIVMSIEASSVAIGNHPATYFMEVFVAREFLDGWLSTLPSDSTPSLNTVCERLIHYAIFDA